MKCRIAISAAFIALSISPAANADDFSRRWLAVLDGERACALAEPPESAADSPYAAICADMHRLYEVMKPAAEKRNRDTLQRLTMQRLNDDLREAQR